MQMSRKLKKTLALVLSLVTVFTAAFTSMADVEVVEEIEKDQVVIPEASASVIADVLADAAIPDAEVDSVLEVEEVVEDNSKEAPTDASAAQIAPLTGSKASGSGWELDDNGTLTIYGTVDCSSGAPWSKQCENILSVTTQDGAKVTNCANLFSFCVNLKNVDLSKLDTSEVISMERMFWNCTSLETLKLGELDTSNVTNMDYMFFGSNIKELSLEGFNLGKVTTMPSLCQNCPSLETVTISSKVNTDSLTTIHQAFSECSKLKTVTLGEGFTVDKVFFDPNLEQLTGCDMGGLFYGSSNLETVKVSESFVISEKCICNWMFENCSQLTGEKGTKASDYDFSLEGKDSGKEREFAHIDEGPANPGFFSALKKTLSSITVTSGPTRTSYTEGENFDPAGIVITATYGDGTTATVTDYTFAPSGALKASDTTVTISYTEGDVTRSATVAITVSRKSDPKPVPTPVREEKEEHEPLYTGTWNNPVKSGAWSQDSHGIWHYTSSEMFRQTWAYIYNPYAHDGQHTSDWFWFDRQGNMLTGWQQIGGKWYYLHTEKDGVLGSCLIGPAVTPDGHTVDATGAWDGNGTEPVSEAAKAGTNPGAASAPYTGTWNAPVQNGAWSLDANGIWHYTTTQQFKNTWAYIYNPYAHDGQHTSDWFWFDEKGNMLTGWQRINGKWYYLHPNKDGVLGSCLIGPATTPDGYKVDETGARID